MPPRFVLVLLVGLLALTACRSNHEGAVKLTVSYSGFRPGCLRVSVKDAEGAGEERTTELAGKGEVTGGTVTVAAFREAGWSNSLTVKAEAFEKTCTTESPPVATDLRTVTVEKGRVAEETLALAASDKDGDGYVSDDAGGHDCDDAETGVNPDARELCNGRDDNCDDKQDEGFDVGTECASTDGCQGIWFCDSQGVHTCSANKPGQWHPDVDRDGEGAQGPGLTSCKKPEGYVANELDCDDTNPRRNTSATELCNDVDDDCDGKRDQGLGLGNSCTGQAGCGGQLACATDGGTMCNSPTPTVLYPDNDQDTRGQADAGVTNCGPTRAGYVNNANDCDDTRANVYVNAPEICDGLDNDCDGPQDETFNLDAGCNPGLGCAGVTACAADGGTQCAYVTPPSNHYPDDDLDQYGKEDAGVLTCTPDAGYILQAGDCNDGNPFTHADAGELCDLEDNDCNGTADEPGTCPAGGGKWVAQSMGTDLWRSVSIWGDGGVWIAGGTNALRLREPGQATFQDLAGHCTGVWYGIWADPRNGNATLGGNTAATGYHPLGAASCMAAPPATNTDVRGVFGLTRANGGLEGFAVGVDEDNTSLGRVFWTDGSTSTPNTNPDQLGPLWDIHGVSRDVLFAVGGFTSPAQPRIYRFRPTQNDWENELVQNIPGVEAGRLRGVWVVNSKLAYAVGESNSVLRWNGTKWSKHSGPSPTEDLLSVLAFGSSSVYVVTGTGRVYRFNGTSWNELFQLSGGVILRDIAGSSPENLWVVGHDGGVAHWPQ
ncbi:putative metal-binding motif-containing protein [Archangium lipolyticum]|uniref:putative metal-binding motif-containing protein n=1 Tax=Archangium lipolyticum TaxID=2970465 RepID=UPI002149B7DE|nr:putative metal-binding motif-containing protein [Archangium lipolyticum]